MEMQGECFVSGPLATILRVTRCAGMAPLRFQKQGNSWRVSLSRGCLILGFIIFGLICIVMIWVIICLLNEKTEMKIRVIVVNAIVTLVFVGMMVFGAPRHTRSLITSINKLQKINSELKVYHWPTPWVKKQVVLCVIWGTVCIMVTVTDFLYLLGVNLVAEPVHQKAFHTTWANIGFCVVFTFNLIIKLAVLQFVFLVLHIRSSFTIVNDSLRSLLYESTISSTHHHKNVHRISSAYSAACDVVREVNRSHGLMLMTLISTLFFKIIFTSYHFFYIFLKEPTAQHTILSISYTVAAFFWFVGEAVNLVILVEPCHLTYVEMERTHKLASQLILQTRPVNRSLMIELKQFCKQLTLNEVSFCPLHVTTISRRLVITIFGSITSYLVILFDE